MHVSIRELESARDAVIRHAQIWERTEVEALAIFEELIRQVKDQEKKQELH